MEFLGLTAIAVFYLGLGLFLGICCGVGIKIKHKPSEAEPIEVERVFVRHSL